MPVSRRFSQLFILLKNFKKGYECSSDGKAAQRHCNGELKFDSKV